MGGETHIMDLVKGATFLKENRPAIYSRLQELIGLVKIDEINDFKVNNAKNTLGIDSVTKHSLVRPYTHGQY